MDRPFLAAVGVIVALSGVALSGAATAQSNPTVVELFTSQGCSSCPPADAYLAEIADRDDVIALALHVDYWDYIGWADTFGSPAFTKRQHGYAQAANQRSVYTPQAVVAGKDETLGSSPSRVGALIAEDQARPDVAQLALARKGASVTIRATALAGFDGEVQVNLVHYIADESVSIARGENAGRTIQYRNVVTGIDNLGTWDGKRALALSAKVKAGEPVVVLLQRGAFGEILAAAQLR